MKHPQERWKGVPVIMTTNRLPSVLREPKRKDSEEEYVFTERNHDYMAFMSRCKLTQMTVSHKNKEVFPYSTDDLAMFMKYYIS